jgi:hypothetical protein
VLLEKKLQKTAEIFFEISVTGRLPLQKKDMLKTQDNFVAEF